MKFKDFKINADAGVKEITWNGNTIQVKQYLPSADKSSIIQCAIQEADRGTVLDTYALEVLFDLYTVFKYTDIEFDDEDRADLYALYDKLEVSGCIDAIVDAIPDDEYEILQSNFEKIVEEYLSYRDSARAVVEQLSIFAPTKAAEIGEQLKDFDVNKMQEILAIAEAAGINN